jgi:hypothetical protein
MADTPPEPTTPEAECALSAPVPAMTGIYEKQKEKIGREQTEPRRISSEGSRATPDLTNQGLWKSVWNFQYLAAEKPAC